MWKDYSRSYLKHNRAACVSVMAAAFIASLFLSLLCCTAYNFWAYELEKIVREEGDWQGRITWDMDRDDLMMIQNFGNVKKAVVNEELSGGQETVADIYFEDARRIFRDMTPRMNHRRF